MGSAQFLTIILAVITATGASLVTAFFSRPKISAEAKAASAGGEVALSADARAWAETFQKRAEVSDAKAEAAEAKADEAERLSHDCQRRVLVLEGQLQDLTKYTFVLRTLAQVNGQAVPPAPESLKALLS